MAKYGNFIYGTNTYGDAPKLNYSVEPMTSTVVSFTEVAVSWQDPAGAFTRIRLTRNQNGFPENSEDGVIVWERYATEGSVYKQDFFDGVENPNSIPLVSGKQVFYTMWLFTDQHIWVKAGEVNDLIPSNHNTQQKLLDILPRVYTSDEQSPLGIVNPTSDLAKFLDGFSFTHEQLLTYIDSMLPQRSRESTAYSLLKNETRALGLPPESGIPVKNQKILVREALYMYQHKGLNSGLSTYVESLTSYAPVLTVSTNLMLTFQDSTFYGGVGDWTATNATITSSTEQVPVSHANAVDTTDSCKIVASGAGLMKNGTADPIRRGVPVKAETAYVISLQKKSAGSDGTIGIVVKWFDVKGELISTSTDTPAQAGPTWSISQFAVTSPALATYASLEIPFSAAGTYFIDQVCFQPGTTAAFDEARAIDVFITPNKTNFILNPSFEEDASNWTLTDGTLTRDSNIPDDAHTGAYSANIEGTDWVLEANPLTVEDGLVAGKYYTLSAYVNSDVEFNVAITSGDTITYSTFPSTDGVWQRCYVSQVIPKDLTDITVTPSLYIQGTSSEFYIDCVQFEKGGVPVYGPLEDPVDGVEKFGVVGLKGTEYFDGDLPVDMGAFWEGTASASFTHMYYNKPVKVARLADTLTSWVPMNSVWRIRSLEQVEYTSNEV
jgi:hypothetical protein